RKNNKDDASKIKNSNIRRDRRKTDQPFSHLHDDRRSGQDSKTSSSGGSRSHSNGKLSAKRYKDVTKRSNKSSAVCHRCGSDKVSSSFSKAEPPLSSHRCDNISVKYLPREGNRVSSTVNSPERPYNPFSSQKSICDSPALVNKTSVSRTCLNDEDSFSTKDQIIESPYFAYDKKHNCLFDDLPQDSDDRTISSSGHLDSCGSKSNPNLHSRISGTYELFSKYWPPKELHGLRESGHDNIQDNRNGDINGNNFLIDEGRQDKNECAEETNRYLNRGEKNSEIQLDNCESSTMKKYGDPASDKSLNNPVLTFEKSWNDKHAVREVNIMKPDYIVSSPYSISEGYDVEKSVTIDWSEIDGDDAGGNDGESLVDLFGRSSPFSFTDGRSTFDVNEDLVSTFVWRRHRLH
ncbi:15189_t:CDS:1, partial [Acaulospora morrowiae]